jgi:hypothetical protein
LDCPSGNIISLGRLKEPKKNETKTHNLEKSPKNRKSDPVDNHVFNGIRICRNAKYRRSQIPKQRSPQVPQEEQKAIPLLGLSTEGIA